MYSSRLTRVLFYCSILLASSGAIYWFVIREIAPPSANPLDIPIQLAANFGEFREDHFHMGMDIRTAGVEGLPVHALSDGYISRISIEENGLGKALYVKQPDGHTVALGHLSRFMKDLETYARQRQYATRRWEQEMELPANQFPVQAGQLIAYSGNTGNSGGPHLHIEVIDDRTGLNCNPLLSGFHIRDEIPPTINSLYWYDRRYSTYQCRAKKIAIKYDHDQYKTSQQVVSLQSPLISIGMNASDKSSRSGHVSGIFKARLFFDRSLIYVSDLSELPASDARYINGCIDYLKWFRSGQFVQHLSLLPGNHISRVLQPGKDGIIHLGDHNIHNIRIEAADLNNNQSSLEFKVQLDSNIKTIDARSSNDQFSIDQSSDNRSPSSSQLLPGHSYAKTGRWTRVVFDSLSFYDKVNFSLVEQTDQGPEKASPLIHLLDPSIPVHHPYQLALKTQLPATSPLRKRTVMQLLCGSGSWVIRGSWKGDWMSGSFMRLGTIQLIVDNQKPTITPDGWTDGQRFPESTTTLQLQCRDNLGVISQFQALIDNHWVPFAKKGGLYTYTFDETCPPGRHVLSVSVTDAAGNETEQTFSFVRE